MGKIIYIASPYSHKFEGKRITRAKQVSQFSAILIKSGLVVFSPISYGHEMTNHSKLPGDFKFWENFCLSFLSKCDEMYVYMMPGWQDSIGIKNEIVYCEKHSIPIKYVPFNKEYHK